MSANFTSHSLSLLAFFLSLCLVCYSALIPEEPDSLNTRERITFPPFFSTISLLSFCLCCLSSFSPTRSLRALLYIYLEREREAARYVATKIYFSLSLENPNATFSVFFPASFSVKLNTHTHTLYIYIYISWLSPFLYVVL